MFLRPLMLVIVSIVFFSVAYLQGYELFKNGTEFFSVISTFCQVSATMMGFMLAALAILASITDKPLLVKMNQQGHYSDLLTHLFAASFVYFIIFGMTAYMLITGESASLVRLLVLTLIVSGGVATMQVGYKFWIVLKNLR